MVNFNYKETYVRVILLKDDISIFHQDLNDEEDFSKKLRILKHCFVSLDILRDSFRHFAFIIKNEEELIKKAKSLKKRLEFINHLRNKISGHLDEKVITKAIQWEPFIFSKDLIENEKARIFLIYKSLIESSINSYIDCNSNQSVFDTEIDLAYPPDQKLFFNYVESLNLDAIDFLTEIEIIIMNTIKFWDEAELFEMAKKAGETDFNLKMN